VITEQATRATLRAQCPDPGDHPAAVRSAVNEIAHEHQLALGLSQNPVKPV